MSDDQIRYLLKRVTTELHETRERLKAAEDEQREPIAIVGTACRLPGGADSPDGLWDLLVSGRDAVAPGYPADRGWDTEHLYDPDPDHPGTSTSRHGAFLSDIAGFDAEFFGISPREALATDPQHRLLLETAWELFERAGIDPTSLHGSRTGVFAGMNGQDYASRLDGIPAAVGGYVGNGNANSIASGRIAYSFGFEGPAVTVDTACSASLVALHLAARSLKSGESDLAVAGGVTLMSSPMVFQEFSRLRGLAADGRCKAFSAAADGTGWGEGVGLLLLERLSDARRNGHRVLAVVRGSAINQDGASNGLTAPSGPAQQRVIRAALADAGLTASDVDAVEGHGTGTTLGDPIEAQALLATYGQGRPDGRPLYLGSVKSNIGHTQAAAGVAGVIKMVEALRHGVLPKTLHVDEPSPHVDWTSGAVELLTGNRDWPETGRVRRAGVSAFGASGTNAHIILEEAIEEAAGNAEARPETAPPAELPFLVSARTPEALADQGIRLAELLESDPGRSWTALAAELASSRAVLEERAVVVAGSRVELVTGLRELAGPSVVSASAPSGSLAVLFTGQGSQRVGMGRELHAAFPVFAAAFDAAVAGLDRELAGHVDRSVREVVFGDLPGDGDADPGLLDRTVYAQAGLFAVETALFRLFESWGIRPDFVSGHSIGEITAAHVAGVLSLDDAVRLVAARGRLMQALPSGGAMVSVRADEARVREHLAGRAGVDIAAVNGPASLVLSGDEDAVLGAAASLAEQGVKTKRLTVSHAFHSAHMEPMLNAFHEITRTLTYHPPRIAVVSNVTGGLASFDADYWVRHVREAVRFHDVVEYLVAEGVKTFVELGPDGVLTAMAREVVPDGTLLAPALRKKRSETRTATLALAHAQAHGARLNWAALLGAEPGPAAPLPTYAFQRQRYWLDPAATAAKDAAALGLGAVDHPLLGAATPLAEGDGVLLTGRLSQRTHPWLADHAVLGTVIVPGTAFVELAVHAADAVGADRLDELVVEAPLVLDGDSAVQLQVSVGEADASGRRAVSVHSRASETAGTAGTGAAWTRHATGTLAEAEAEADSAAAAGMEPAADDWHRQWPPPQADPVEVAAVRGALAAAGLEYGPSFQGLRAVWRRGGELFAEIALPESEHADAARFGLHPALLDAALHIAVVPDLDAADDGPARNRLPFAYRRVRLHASGATALRVRLVVRGPDELSLSAVDGAGNTVVAVESLVTRPVTADQLRPAAALRDDSLFRIDWTEAPNTTGDSLRWTLLAADPVRHDTADALAADVLVRLQGWLADDAEDPDDGARLAVLTRGAVAAAPGEGADPAAAAAWGLVRSAQAEYPGRIVLADLDPATELPAAPDPELTGILDAAAAGGETQLAVRGSRALVPRLVRAPDAGDRSRTPAPDGTVLITGGTGVLGAVLARHLVAEHGVRRLLLTSRRGPDAPGAQALREELTALGAEVTVTAADVADRAALTALLDTIPAAHPLTGVVHTAGVVDDGVLTALTPDRFTAVLRPKADAARHLHELTLARGDDLAFFVLFSSVSGLLGGPGQANYAAANTFLDALAAERASAGLPAHALAWGQWAQASGMTAHLTGADHARAARLGLRAFPSAEGVRLFDAALRQPSGALVPAPLDLAGLARRAAEEGVPPLLRSLARPARRAAQAVADDRGSALAQRLTGLDAAEQTALLMELVRTEVATVLGSASGAVGAQRAFSDLGMDSLTAVELRNRLGAVTGLRLPATLVFDYPTPAALTGLLRDELAGATASTSVTTAALRDPAATDRRPDPAGPDEPIAIVGMACRLPGGVDSPEALWRLVEAGGDAITGFPDDRGWDLDALYDPDPDRPGTSYTRQGGFLHDAGDFDADFFGISPREALATDPQQRLLLETSWEALESAGLDAAALRGSRTGIFAGVMYHDYGPPLEEAPVNLEGLLGNGNAGSVATGRIAYSFGFEGPAVTVDTACSSSLVALHLAAQSLRTGECDLALAGGVALMATPAAFTEFSRQRGLAPDGRSKAFSADADGVGWAEGVGLILVERLSDAVRNGHRVLAVVRGTAINQDGASNGLTAPNGPAQQRVIRQALTNAGLKPTDIDAVEAHGTGTTLGDPIEAQAVLATYGQGRADELPLYLGSLKSNIGHTQAAAGAAGIIKMVQALRHGVLPKTLHAQEPSPHVDWSAGAVELLTEARAWPESGRVRRAAVSSFGVSGTNAHVILEQGPEEALIQDESDGSASDALPWAVTGRSAAAVRDQAARVLDATSELPDLDVSHALLTTRALLEERAVAVGDRDGLRALAEGQPSAAVVRGTADVEGRTVFVFPGQGAQWVGMAAELLDSAPVFADRIAEAEAALQPYVDWSLTEVLRSGAGLERVDVVQPALWAVMVSLAALWQSYGVRPDAVVGHSQGEIAAAVVAGGLSLEDGARVVALRSRAILALSGRGGMASIALPAREVAGRIGEGISIAVVNGPSATVVSGDPDALKQLVADYEAEGVRARLIPVDYASHSAHVDAIQDDILTALADLRPVTGSVPFLSSVTGQFIDTATLDAGYWFTNLRETVRFDEAVRALADDGHAVFIEVSAHPVLVTSIQETLEATGHRKTVATGSLRRDEGGLERFRLSLAEVFVRGVAVDWSPVFAGRTPRRVDLPTYAFQRTRYWLDSLSSGSRQEPVAEDRGNDAGASLLRGLLAGLSADDERLALLLEHVRAEAAAVLGHDGADGIDADRAFQELGLNSLTGVELRNRLGEATGLRLPATLVFDHPTPAAIAAFLHTQLHADAAAFGDPAQDSALASLDRLEAGLSSVSPELAEHAEILGRLRDILARWEVPGSGLGALDGIDLDSATDDDLFDLLDNNLESS